MSIIGARIGVIMSGPVPSIMTEVAAVRRRGVEVRGFAAPDPRPSYAAAWVRTLASVREFDPDLVHCHFGALHGLASFPSAIGRPFVLSIRGSDLNPLSTRPVAKQRIKCAITRWLSTRASAVITVSEALRLRLPEGIRDVATVIPAGVDFSVFRPICRRDALRHIGIGVDQPIVLFVTGSYPAIKRRDLALAAFGLIRGRIPGAHFIELDGRQPHGEMPAYLSSASVLLFTSSSEGSPNIVKEALACETPLVTVDVGDVARMAEGVSNARVVPPDASAIAAAAVSLILEPPVRNSRELGRARFCVERTAAAVLDVYCDVLGLPRQQDSPHS